MNIDSCKVWRRGNCQPPHDDKGRLLYTEKWFNSTYHAMINDDTFQPFCSCVLITTDGSYLATGDGFKRF